MVGSSRDRKRKVWGHRTHEFFVGWIDTNMRNIGEVVVVPWSFRAQVTGRVISLLYSHQEGLGLPRFSEDDFFCDDPLCFGGAVLACSDGAKPLDCLPKGLDSQLTDLFVGRNGILERWWLGLDPGRPDTKPFGEMLDEVIELRVCLKRGFKAIEYPTRR